MQRNLVRAQSWLLQVYDVRGLIYRLTACKINESSHVNPMTRTNDRSGAEVALEYFPDSILSSPADLNATYFETGLYISDRQQQKLSPVAPNGDGTTNRAPALGVRYARGAVKGGGSRELERLLLVNGYDEGAAAAAAAAAAVMGGVGGAAAPAGIKLSTSDGARGLLRRLLSRGKLRRSLQASSSRAAAVDAASTTEALVVGEDSR